MDEQPDREHLRPDGASDESIAAAGKMSEALESVERARGHLHSFHQLIGKADFELDEVLELLRACGATDLEEQVRTDLIGRNVVPGRWTFQLIEEFDETYWEVFRAHERAVRDELAGGRRHVYESELKERRRTHGRPGHEARPTGHIGDLMAHDKRDMGDDDAMGIPDSAAAQITLNETTFREVNEGIEEGRREREGLVPFVCECGEMGCNAVVRLTLREYERVRAGSRSFLVAPGHGAEFDQPIYEGERYGVVAKPDGPLGELADRTDPRRDPA
jgi:hypothetical protein